MFAQAQNGKAIELMAQQFGLAQEQMTKATAALLPAFSAAFKRNTANPYDFGALLTALGSGNYAKYFEDISQAFTPQGMVDGNGVLGQLFGSKEMSRAIAAQNWPSISPAPYTSVMLGLLKSLVLSASCRMRCTTSSAYSPKTSRRITFSASVCPDSGSLAL